MHTKLIPIGNSFGIRIPKSIIKQFDLNKSNLEMIIKEDGIFITPFADVPPISEWDRLFKDAKKNGFNSKEDSKEFSDWNITLNDGDEQL